MTAILVLLMQNESHEEYVARVSRPKAPNTVDPVKPCVEVASTVCDETFSTPKQSPNKVNQSEGSDDDKPPMTFQVETQTPGSDKDRTTETYPESVTTVESSASGDE